MSKTTDLYFHPGAAALRARNEQMVKPPEPPAITAADQSAYFEMVQRVTEEQNRLVEARARRKRNARDR